MGKNKNKVEFFNFEKLKPRLYRVYIGKSSDDFEIAIVEGEIATRKTWVPKKVYDGHVNMYTKIDLRLGELRMYDVHMCSKEALVDGLVLPEDVTFISVEDFLKNRKDYTIHREAIIQFIEEETSLYIEVGDSEMNVEGVTYQLIQFAHRIHRLLG